MNPETELQLVELELEGARRDERALTELAISNGYLDGTLAKLMAAEKRVSELEQREEELRRYAAERPASWGTW